jgi:hypothetical protein
MRSFNGNSGALVAQPELATGELATARRALHRALGPNLDIYTAVIDNRNGCVTLQIELAAGRVPDAMAIIMSTLPEAEFGSIRPAVCSSTH